MRNVPQVGMFVCVAVLLALQARAEGQKGDATKSFIYKKTKQADLAIFVHYPPGWKETDSRYGVEKVKMSPSPGQTSPTIRLMKL